MNRNIKATLEQNGHDTSNYLSLRINKGDLPHGGEVVVSVRDAQTGELRPITLEQDKDKPAFARNSHFYNQVMADGHIFNPYIHRRYIAAQFRRLIRQYGYQGIKQGVAQSYTWDYAIDILCKEAHRLANLEKHDREGFIERSQFFMPGRCACILADYADAVAQYLDGFVSRSRTDTICVPHYGTVQKQNVRPMKYRFTKLADLAKSCMSYRQLDNLLFDFEWLSLPNDLSLPDSFVEPFVETGAYFTMKHHIMFEGLRIWGCSQQKSLEHLRKHNGNYLSLYQSVMD